LLTYSFILYNFDFLKTILICLIFHSRF
jgi:hypothetical protein